MATVSRHRQVRNGCLEFFITSIHVLPVAYISALVAAGLVVVLLWLKCAWLAGLSFLMPEVALESRVLFTLKVSGIVGPVLLGSMYLWLGIPNRPKVSRSAPASDGTVHQRLVRRHVRPQPVRSELERYEAAQHHLRRRRQVPTGTRSLQLSLYLDRDHKPVV